jgi:hypothetical protein
MGKALVPSLRDSLGLSRPTPGTSVPGFRMPPPFDFAQGRLSRLEPGNGSFGARFRDSASRDHNHQTSRQSQVNVRFRSA